MTPRHDARDKPVEILLGKSRSFHHLRPLSRPVQILNYGTHVIVEREQIDPPVGQPSTDLGFGIEIVGFMAQVETGIRRKLRSPRKVRGSSDEVLNPHGGERGNAARLWTMLRIAGRTTRPRDARS